MTIGYWATAGARKTFTHPLDPGWLAAVPRASRVVDYGCGYGRLMAELSDAGFTDVSGVDVSAAMLERGRRARPDLRFDLIGVRRFEPASVDVVLLFAVLTCVPADRDQAALIGAIARMLRPGGLLYVSDLLREPGSARYDDRGVFTTSDGAVCRHHDLAGLRRALAGFRSLRERQITVTTMNGHPARGVQLLAEVP